MRFTVAPDTASLIPRRLAVLDALQRLSACAAAIGIRANAFTAPGAVYRFLCVVVGFRARSVARMIFLCRCSEGHGIPCLKHEFAIGAPDPLAQKFLGHA